MKKRSLSLLLILCMAVSLLPTAVFAEEPEATFGDMSAAKVDEPESPAPQEPSEEPEAAETQEPSEETNKVALQEAPNGGTSTVSTDVAQIGDTNYTSLADAVNAAGDGDTVKLLKNVELSDPITISTSITINGGGKTITGVANNQVSLFHVGQNVKDPIKVTIENCTFEIPENNSQSGWSVGIYVQNKVDNLTIQNNTFNIKAVKSGGSFQCIGLDYNTDRETKNVLITGNVVNDKHTSNGGTEFVVAGQKPQSGAYLSEYSTQTLMITNNELYGNQAKKLTGVLVSNVNGLTVTDNTFVDCYIGLCLSSSATNDQEHPFQLANTINEIIEGNDDAGTSQYVLVLTGKAPLAQENAPITLWDVAYGRVGLDGDTVTGDAEETLSKISFNTNGGTFGEDQNNPGRQITDITYVAFDDTAITLPAAPTRSGYTFTGWQTVAPEGQEPVELSTNDKTYTAENSLLFFAQWEENGGGETPPTDKPEPPTDLYMLDNLAAVKCIHSAEHTTYSYRLSSGDYDVGSVKQDSDGTYTCTLTIQAAPFVEKYSETRCGVHRLVDSAPESKQLTLSWDTKEHKWYVDYTRNGGRADALFEVTCEPETTDVYVYFQTVDADGNVISVDRNNLGLTKNGNVGNWYTLGTLKTDTALTTVPVFDSDDVVEYEENTSEYAAVSAQLYAALKENATPEDKAKFVRDQTQNMDFVYADKIEWTGEFKTAKAGDHYVDGGKKNCHAYHFDGVLPLYKATFVTEDETNVTGMPADGYYLYEEQLTMTAPSRPGYKFMGWQVEVESNDGGEIIMSANDPATDEGALLQKDNVYTFTSNNVTFTAVWEADMKTVQIVIYRNGDTTTAYKTVPLHQMQKGTTLDLTTIDINDYYTNQGSAGKTDFDFDGWYNDGTWNKYVQDTENPPAGLEKITVNGWTNIICMVYDYEKVVYFQTAEALKDYQEDHSKTEGLLYSTTARKGSALPTADAPTATREGYTFQFWSREGQSSDVTGQTVNGWTNLYANWELTEYTITYGYRDKDIRDKANLQPTNPDKYTVEDAITLNPITAKGEHGKRFAEWRCDLDDDGVAEEITEIPKGTTGNLTIFAYWNYPVNYTVFDENGDKIDLLSKTKYVSEDVLSSEDGYTLTALTEYGYDFDGWYQDKKDMNGGSTIDALKTAKKWELYGKLTRKEYTVSSDLRVNGNERYKDGRDFPWTTTVSGLYGANVDYDILLLAMKTMALKADAANEPNKDKVDIELHWNDGHGKVFEPETYGAEGYNWRDMGNGRNVAYAWGYAYTYYDVGFETGEGATNVDSQLVKSGDKLTAITAPTKEGYAFTGWTIKDTNEAFNPAEDAVTRSMTLVAGWTANEYTVTFNPNADDAKVAPANKEVTYDAPYGELPTPTRENYRFVGWYLNGERVTEDTIVKTAGDHTLLAGWSRSYYALTINYVDKNGKKLEESYEASVALGADYSVTSPKIKGYKLKCKDDAVITGTMTAAGFTYDVVYLKVTGNGGGVTITESPNKIKPKAPKLALNTADHFAYVDGYPDGTVKPEGDVTRAETAAILYRIMDDECRAYYETSTSTYADVSRSDWFSTYVATLEKAGVIADTRAYEKFRPNEAITRAELASMLAQFAGLKSASTANFNDVGSHYWAADEIAIAAKMGWINGYPDGSFRPNATVTRAELMAMVNRALERTPQSEDDLLSGMKTWRDNANVDAWYYLDVQEATNDHTYTKSGDHETWKKLL